MRTTLPLIALLAALAAPSLAAQNPAGLLRDPAVENHRLSMTGLRNLLAVQRGLNALAKSEPALLVRLGREVEALERSGRAPRTVAEEAGHFDRHPRIRRVFTEAGTTPREWLLTLHAVANATIGLGVKEGTTPRNAVSTPSTAAHHANVALLEANAAAWQAIADELERLHEDPAWVAVDW
jgi:hypothetical protein